MNWYFTSYVAPERGRRSDGRAILVITQNLLLIALEYEAGVKVWHGLASFLGLGTRLGMGMRLVEDMARVG